MCLTGCGSQQPETVGGINSFEEKNSFIDWREKLPRDTEMKSLKSEEICGITIVKDGKTILEVAYDPREYKDSFDYWNITVPYESRVTADTEVLYALFDVVAQFGYTDAGNIGVEETGIMESSTSLFLAYAEGGQTSAQKTLRPNRTQELLIGKEDGQGNYYVALKEASSVYCVEKSLVDNVLQVNPFQCILKVVQLVSLDTIAQVNVLINDKICTMEKAENVYKMNGKEVPEDTFKEYYGKLLGVMIQKEMSGDNISEERENLILTLQFIRNMEDASDIEICFYDYGGEYASVSVDEKISFLVNKGEVEALTKAFKNLS